LDSVALEMGGAKIEIRCERRALPIGEARPANGRDSSLKAPAVPHSSRHALHTGRLRRFTAARPIPPTRSADSSKARRAQRCLPACRLARFGFLPSPAKVFALPLRPANPPDLALTPMPPSPMRGAHTSRQSDSRNRPIIQPLALIQSRRTVRSSMPSAAPISASPNPTKNLNETICAMRGKICPS